MAYIYLSTCCNAHVYAAYTCVVVLVLSDVSCAPPEVDVATADANLAQLPQQARLQVTRVSGLLV